MGNGICPGQPNEIESCNIVHCKKMIIHLINQKQYNKVIVFQKRNVNVFSHIPLGHCFNYITLSDSWRKIGSGSSKPSGSPSGSDNSNFNGNNWFRFVEPAGVKLSNTASDARACGQYSSGWMRGSDPTIVGQTLDRTACFSYSGYQCYWSRNIKVSLCSDNNNEQFLIYQLRKPPYYYSVYCAKSN